VVEELTHRVDSNSTLWATGDNDAFATLGDARWIINEVGKIVALNLTLDRGEQFGFEHWTLQVTERNGTLSLPDSNLSSPRFGKTKSDRSDLTAESHPRKRPALPKG
jgi:hypothetical protein